MENITILGSGYATAKNCIHNEDFTKILDTSDEWIQTRTGIRSRYMSNDENTSDLGYRAAKQAIEHAGIQKEEIDLIIVATMTPDNITPSTACLVQAKLGLNDSRVMAFDLNAACSGFVFAFQVACSMLQTYRYALVIGSETISKILDYEDRSTCVLFGDGAGAMVLKSEKSSKQLAHFAQSSGDVDGFLKADGLALRTSLENSEQQVGYLQQNGSEVFRFAIKALELSIQEVLAKANRTLDEIDLIIPHQANLRIIRNVAKRMKISEDVFYLNVDRYGNTSAASIPIAFAEAAEKGVIKSGMKVILVGFGAGFTYAASYIEL